MKHQFLVGDMQDILPDLNGFDFIFADPPFNIGQSYNYYVDDREDYETFIIDCIEELWDACDGVLCLHGNNDLAKIFMKAEFKLGLNPIGWVNWHYRFGQCRTSQWIDSRTHCLIYSRHKAYTWNADQVRVKSDRATVYADERTKETPNGGTRLPFDIWGLQGDGKYWGRVQGNNKERCPHNPNQLPIRYLQRLILTYTNPGDRVLDPFLGTGTTGIVAVREGREFTGIDISPESVKLSKDRAYNGFYREM